MLRGMFRLTTTSDVLRPLITLLVGGMLAGILTALIGPGSLRSIVLIIVGAIALAVILTGFWRVCWRCRELLQGHCPNPLCHGVVQKSEHAARGNLVCPTCRKQWPEIRGIEFKTTSRQW